MRTRHVSLFSERPRPAVWYEKCGGVVVVGGMCHSHAEQGTKTQQCRRAPD